MFKKYPSLYKNRHKTLMHFGCTCGNGWFELIDTLSALIVERSAEVIASQIKEKFGVLRFYFMHCAEADYDYIFGLITMAEALSSNRCEQCSRKVGVYSMHQACTRCEQHKLLQDELIDNKKSINVSFTIAEMGLMWQKILTDIAFFKR